MKRTSKFQLHKYIYIFFFLNVMDFSEVFEEMDDIIKEMGSESSDEDQTLSNDSDCISDCNEDLTEISEKIIANSQINTLNVCMKCTIYFYYFYYSTDALAVCGS